MVNGLRISDFTITIDLDCSFPEYKTPSILIMTFEFIEFVVEISRTHVDKDQQTATVKYSSTGNFQTDQFPKNAHTEIIAAELKSSPLKEKLKNSLGKWSVVFQNLFQASLKEINFPKLCYYCP
jgi:putative lipoic acid-binding regulatory protein